MEVSLQALNAWCDVSGEDKNGKLITKYRGEAEKS